MEIIFATQNKNKVREISSLISSGIIIKGLDETIFTEELPETGNTLEENALQKAEFVFSKCHLPCFADDSGLEVGALGGNPGVNSARYAGEEKNADANMNKLLGEMKNISNRNATFKTVIAYVDKGGHHLFEGIVKGKILHEKKGCEGFGYDPVFMPNGYSCSFAEMKLEEKNKISHRAMAFRFFSQYIDNLVRKTGK